MADTPPLVLIRGGGDLATGIAARLWRSGFKVMVTEIEQPLAVRRLVSLAEAIYEGEVTVEDLRAHRVTDPETVRTTIEQGLIPVLIDPTAESRNQLEPYALIDARMTKAKPDLPLESAPMMIGVGPGFQAAVDVHAVVETNRGHRMGRVIWEGEAQADTSIPDPVNGRDVDRVLRAPEDGIFEPFAEIGTLVKAGTKLAEVNGVEILAPFDGALRGLLRGGIRVEAGLKVGDLDPRQDLTLCTTISDKALAVGGGVLEALLTRKAIRQQLANTSS